MNLSKISKQHLEKIVMINNKWLAHGRIQKSADSYLSYLKNKDESRLSSTLGVVMDSLNSMWEEEGMQDPKCVFYAALFCQLKDRNEYDTYLRDFRFTEAVLAPKYKGYEIEDLSSEVGYDTQKKIESVRNIIDRSIDITLTQNNGRKFDFER